MQRRTWILGASAGIGAALAKELAARGDRLALSARNGRALDALCAELPTSDTAAPHITLPLDVCDRDALTAAKTRLVDAWQGVDRIIFMAGLYEPMPMDALNLDETRTILEVNLLSAFYVADMALPLLRDVARAQLVFCASVAGFRGLPKGQPYGASKAGLINMVESLRAECGKRLDVRLINPGFVESRLTDKNDFAMPARITAESAARRIARGLDGRAFEIHFPKRFTWGMKLIRLLPPFLYFRLFS